MRFATTASRVRRTAALSAATLVMTAASVAASVVVAPGAVHAEGGLEITSTTKYRVRPAKEMVDVVVTAAYKNVLTSDGSAKGIYFSGSYLPLPGDAINPTLTSGEAPLNFTLKPGQGKGEQLMDFQFTSNLNYGQQTAVELRYSLPSGAPRDDKNQRRINPAYVGFEASAVGDPGRTVLEIELPLEFKLDKTSSLNGVPAVDGEKTRTYRLGGDGSKGDGNADGLQWAWVSATNVEALAPSTVELSGAEVQVLAWPNDPEWTEYAEKVVRDAVPYLEKKFGAKWPATDTKVREAGTPYIYRRVGWYDQSGDIELGENRNRRIAIHQLAHAWLDPPTFTERWMIEGVAQYISAVGMSELYDKEAKPPEPNRFKPPLEAWTDETRGDSAVEADGYNESWYTIDAIFEVAGEDKLPDLMEAATKNQTRTTPLPDHQILLNVMEPATGDNVTTSTEVSTILVQHVLDKPAIAPIKDRNSTREARGALVGAASKWGVPTAVDQSINDWNFKRSNQLIGWATDTLKSRNELTNKARTANLEVGTASLQTKYQEASNEEQFAAVATQAQALSDSLDNVAEARDKTQGAGGVWYSVGSWYSDPPEEHLEAAKQALADGDSKTADAESRQAIATIEATPERGRFRAGIAAVSVAVMVLVLFVFLRRRSKRKADQDASAIQAPPPPPDPNHIGSFMGAAAGATTTDSTETAEPDTDPDDPPAIQPVPPEIRPAPPEIQSDPPEIRRESPDPQPAPSEWRPLLPKIQPVPPELLDPASQEVTPDVESDSAD